VSFDRFVGLPYADKGRGFAGVDCWGLVHLVFASERGIALPSYADRYETAEDRRDVAGLIAGEIGRWDEIAEGQERPFDCVLLREGREPSHISLVVRPGRMLHVQDGRTSVIESYRSGVWKRRVVGLFRYRT
jgi:cell wall-associated NlpC family hydrolase